MVILDRIAKYYVIITIWCVHVRFHVCWLYAFCINIFEYFAFKTRKYSWLKLDLKKKNASITIMFLLLNRI